jgi:hypothetical protein
MGQFVRAAAFTALLLSVGRVARAQAQTAEVSTSRLVSIVELLAEAPTIHAQRVTVTGYLVLDFEGEALYLHKEDYENRLTSNAIRVALTEKQKEEYKEYAGQYVWLDASFVKRKNSSDFFKGALFDIREIHKTK